MRVDAIMMALFVEDNSKIVKSITNNRIIYADGTEKLLKEGVKEYKELFNLTDNQLY